MLMQSVLPEAGLGTSHGLAVGSNGQLMNSKKWLRVVTFSTDLVQKTKLAHLPNYWFNIALSFCHLCTTHLFPYDFFCQGGQAKYIFVYFSQTFNLFLVLSLYWACCPGIQKSFTLAFSWDTSIKESLSWLFSNNWRGPNPHSWHQWLGDSVTYLPTFSEMQQIRRSPEYLPLTTFHDLR